MIETVALVLTGLSLTASIVYYAKILQNANKTRELQLKAQEQVLETRKTEIFLRYYGSDTEEHVRTTSELVHLWKWDGYEDFETMYRLDPENHSKFVPQMQRYNGLGLLGMRGQVDLDLIYMYSIPPIVSLWEKFGDLVKEMRVRRNNPDLYIGFEFLYNEMIKRRDNTITNA